jgi:DNA (cytosine-5)-methyltransferase 1
MSKIPILSFFSGGGFMDMGFEQSGFHITWANEYDSVFTKLYKEGVYSWRSSKGPSNIPSILNEKSIIDISVKDILKEAFPGGKPKHFGIIGGPPCQDFSTNGKLKGFIGDRGKLTLVFFNKIIELRPTFFVMENVTGLISRKSTRQYLNHHLRTLEKYYIIDYKKLNSLDFGVPQHRERIFFIGILKKSLSKQIIKHAELGQWFTFPVNKKYLNAAKKYEWGKVVPFGTKIRKPNNLPLELCVSSCLVDDKNYFSLPNANEYFPLYKSPNQLIKINEGETNRPSFKRLHRYKYSPTACYGNNEVHLHPFLNRRISVREALRIQGVPDTYILSSNTSLSKKFKMIGNGVPVPLAKAVADSLKKYLLQNQII